MTRGPDLTIFLTSSMNVYLCERRWRCLELVVTSLKVGMFNCAIAVEKSQTESSSASKVYLPESKSAWVIHLLRKEVCRPSRTHSASRFTWVGVGGGSGTTFGRERTVSIWYLFQASLFLSPCVSLFGAGSNWTGGRAGRFLLEKCVTDLCLNAPPLKRG